YCPRSSATTRLRKPEATACSPCSADGRIRVPHETHARRSRGRAAMPLLGFLGFSSPEAFAAEHGDLSEIHQFSAVTLVMADVSEEFIAVSLGEVSPYSDLILAYDLHHILD